MAPPVCNNMSYLPLTTRISAIPGAPPLFDTSIHMVSTKSRHSFVIPRIDGLHSAVLALGIDGI
jgi:hypothetical protein